MIVVNNRIKWIGIGLLITGVLIFIVTSLALRLSASASIITNSPVYDLVSVNNVDGQGINKNAYVAGISSDGDRIAYWTSATNLPDTLTPNPTGGYIRTLSTSSTQRIDVSDSGVVPDLYSQYFVMSETGRYVAFISTATNLIDGTTLSTGVGGRVYIKDMQTGDIELVTPNLVGTANGFVTKPISVSHDGRFVAVTTPKINELIPGTRASTAGAYLDSAVYDRSTASWILLNQPSSGILQNNYATIYSASCDGSYYVMQSDSTNLTPAHSGSGFQLYLIDIRNGVSITNLTPGITANNGGYAVSGITMVPEISCNGRYITYGTQDRTVITPNPTGIDSYAHVVRYDRITGERRYVYAPSFDKARTLEGLSAVSDLGDVISSFAVNAPPYPDNRKVYLAHLSGATPTRKAVQIPSLTYKGVNAIFDISADSKYVVVTSKDGNTLGLPVANDGIYNVIRIATGI